MTHMEVEKIVIYVSETPEARDEAFVLIVEVSDPHIVTWRIPNLEKSQWYFFVRVVDTEGRESAFSNSEGKQCK